MQEQYHVKKIPHSKVLNFLHKVRKLHRYKISSVQQLLLGEENTRNEVSLRLSERMKVDDIWAWANIVE